MSNSHEVERRVPLPQLPTAQWRDTCETLHLFTQIVGKIRLKRSPWLNHSWHVTLYVTARGLSTSPIPDGARTFQIDFDFIAHDLQISTSDGAQRQFALSGHSVASFYQAVMAALGQLDIDVAIDEMPNEVAEPIKFSQDTRHASYDPDAVRRFLQILVSADRVFKQFRMRPTIPKLCGASIRSSRTATAYSSNSAPALSARRARCISSGAVLISR